MKKTAAESKIIRFYMLIWGLLILGVLIVLPFAKTQSQWRYVALAGFLLSIGSFIVAVGMVSLVQIEIRARYPKAIGYEKQFLTALFYFVRGTPLIFGVLILLFASLRKDILAKDVVAVGGKIASIEVMGQEHPRLKITFDNNSNQYEIHTFRIFDEKLKQLEAELQRGDSVAVLVGRDDEHAVDRHVQIYGIRTETKIHLSLDEYNKSDTANNFVAYVLGLFFVGSGLFCSLTGRIKTKPDAAMRLEQNAFKA